LSIESTGPNAEMIDYWNENSGERWVRHQSLLDGMIEPLGTLAMERTGVSSGERVLDVGCGCGQTCLQLAERVGPDGTVRGIDISHPMLERARERARQQGLDQVSFENADAQIHRLEPSSTDLVFSRFGVMFFADPGAAFANLRDALASGGRIAFACWQALDRNPWLLVPLGAVAQHVPLPERPEPGAPGPFSLADPERLRQVLDNAGYRGVQIEAEQRELVVGGRGPLDQAIDFIFQIGPLATILREAGERGTELLPVLREAVREAVLPYTSAEGLRMPSASWIVTARAR